MTRLIIDTDTAGDDVFSLLIALLPPARAAGGDHRLLRERPLRTGGRERAVHGRDGRPGGRGSGLPGCRKPLVGEWVGAEYVHGNDGMGDSNFPQAKQRPEGEHAVDELVRRINESPGELTILARRR